MIHSIDQVPFRTGYSEFPPIMRMTIRLEYCRSIRKNRHQIDVIDRVTWLKVLILQTLFFCKCMQKFTIFPCQNNSKGIKKEILKYRVAKGDAKHGGK